MTGARHRHELKGLKKPFRDRVSMVYVEDVLDNLAHSTRLSPRLATTVWMLREKYLLPPDAAP